MSRGSRVVLVLSGIVIIVLGFMVRLNPLLVVTIAALATGIAAGLDPVAVVSAFGKAFNDNRYVSVVWIVLPVIGLLERYGLQQRARTLIADLRGATVGRLLIVYLIARQIAAALGLTSIAGHAQTVRPLVAPMAEAAAEAQMQTGRTADEETREEVKAMAAATDNVGLFFGEDIFIAIASILLIKSTFETYGITLAPIELSVWAIPTAIAALLIHGARLMLLDRRLGAR
ncbi:putative membrane protein [Sphingosinicella soli]|uniref:Putative membrane protein n=1 Tax=Sphingosinicella soli TaxID=333708 RepID=A0A7W7F5R1_9SPHN|nr:DUF969 domain-containing protein [Sphingosinicella soli]MBB4630919.1 putative membrane protein [Sphingosinicella soli]